MNCRFRNPTNTKAIGKQGCVRVERSRSKLKLNALTVGEHGRANWSPYMNLYTRRKLLRLLAASGTTAWTVSHLGFLTDHGRAASLLMSQGGVLDFSLAAQTGRFSLAGRREVHALLNPLISRTLRRQGKRRNRCQDLAGASCVRGRAD